MTPEQKITADIFDRYFYRKNDFLDPEDTLMPLPQLLARINSPDIQTHKLTLDEIGSLIADRCGYAIGV